LENDPRADLPSVAVRLDNPRRYGKFAFFQRGNHLRGDVEEIFTSASRRAQVGADRLQIRPLSAISPQILKLTEDERLRDLLPVGTRLHLLADGAMILIEGHVVDAGEGGHIDPRVAALHAMHLKLWQIEYSWRFDSRRVAKPDDGQTMWFR